MGQFFSTTGPTFKRHVHKWADRNVKRDVSPRQCDDDPTAVHLGRAIIIITYPYGDFKHYENTPMQYTAIFTAVKIDKFQLKKKLIDIFLIFAQNIE